MKEDSDLSSPGAGEPPRKATSEAAPYSALYEEKKAWLPWKEHGLRAHLVTGGGYVKEIEDIKIRPHRKPKAVSSRQWEAV